MVLKTRPAAKKKSRLPRMAEVRSAKPPVNEAAFTGQMQEQLFRRSRGRADNLFQQMGALRVALVAGAIVDMLAAPSPGAPVIYAGADLVTTLIVPVLAPILLQVLLLDALMGRVLMSSHTGAERARYRRIVTVNLVIVFLLVLRWTPYFLALGKS